MLSVIMLSVVMLSVIMLSVIMLNVVFFVSACRVPGLICTIGLTAVLLFVGHFCRPRDKRPFCFEVNQVDNESR